MQTARSVAGRRVAAPAPRVARAQLSRGRFVVQAAKKSVGDLSKADLEGKRVFVRYEGWTFIAYKRHYQLCGSCSRCSFTQCRLERAS